jgi:hypothetical protein
MGNQQSDKPDLEKSRRSAEPDMNYAPKTYTPREQLAFGVKLFAIAGLVVLLFWLIDKYV